MDPRYEISAVIKKLDLLGKHPLVYFEKVKGFSMPVVCNTDSSLAKFGVAFGVPPQEVRRFYNEREEECMRLNKYPAKEVSRSDAPCKEVVKIGKKVNMLDFPFPIHHEGEVPYLTRAVGIVNHEKAKCPHAGHYRLMVRKSHLGVTHITPGRHLWDIWKEKSDHNKPLEIAFVVGIHPALAMATQSRIAHPPSELDVAGSLLKESLRVVRCETIDVVVPALAEIVIEGEIPPNTFEEEGPWADFTHYRQVGQRQAVRIKAITHRKNPIVHDMGAWPTGRGFIAGIPNQAFMNRRLKEAVPDVKLFKFGPPLYGFIQLDKKHSGQPKQAILAAFANEVYLKYVVCFDTDIDLENGAQMLWALSTRVQAERDVMVLPRGIRVRSRFVGSEESVQTKVGIDATAKPFLKDLPPVGKVPEEIINRIDLKDYIGDPGDYL